METVDSKLPPSGYQDKAAGLLQLGVLLKTIVYGNVLE